MSVRFVCILEGRNGELDPRAIVSESLVCLLFDSSSNHPYNTVCQALLDSWVWSRHLPLCPEVQHECAQGIFLQLARLFLQTTPFKTPEHNGSCIVHTSKRNACQTDSIAFPKTVLVLWLSGSMQPVVGNEVPDWTSQCSS